jgi:hypothetical protein
MGDADEGTTAVMALRESEHEILRHTILLYKTNTLS